jgi:hypothetical protein
MSRSTMLARLLLVVASLAVLVTPTASTQAASSEQVVFSKTGASFTLANNTTTPLGFWIWCEATLTNPGAYAGQCSGSIYFYAIKLAAEHVDGSIGELAKGQYRMTVHSADWSCTLTNVPPVTRGPTNSVVVICSTPSGNGTATGSVVNVTGP